VVGGRGAEHAEELRERFLANRAKFRSWIVDWDCPELQWPEVSAIPPVGCARAGLADVARA
jgi:hypothetical protein